MPLLADIALHWLLLIFVVGGLIFLVLIGKMYEGNGSDLLDFPSRDSHDRMASDREDLQGMIQAENNRRRKQGRPEVTEDQIHRDGIGALEDKGDRRGGDKGSRKVKDDWGWD